MKKLSIFAGFKTKNTKHVISIDGIFYARLDACICKDKEAVQIPAAVIEICQCSWSRWEASSLSYLQYFIFSLAMTKNNENASSAQGAYASTSAGTKSGFLSFNDILSLIQKQFEVEMNEKNELYSFLIHHRLMDQFMSYKEKQQF